MKALRPAETRWTIITSREMGFKVPRRAKKELNSAYAGRCRLRQWRKICAQAEKFYGAKVYSRGNYLLHVERLMEIACGYRDPSGPCPDGRSATYILVPKQRAEKYLRTRGYKVKELHRIRFQTSKATLTFLPTESFFDVIKKAALSGPPMVGNFRRN